MGSMFINALLFGVENNIRKRLNIDTYVEGNRPYHLYAVSGAIAGLAQSFLLSPVELIKIKMQIPQSNYTSTWQCTRDLDSSMLVIGLRIDNRLRLLLIIIIIILIICRLLVYLLLVVWLGVYLGLLPILSMW